MWKENQPTHLSWLRHNSAQMNWRIFVFAVAIMLLFSLSRQIARAADGDLDPTFGNGGKVITDFNNSQDYLYRIAVQPDGKIVAIGTTRTASEYSKFALARYNPDGTLDATFGSGGKVKTLIPNGGLESATGLLILPNGKIMIAGSIDLPSSQNTSFALLRYNSDGSLDTTFGNGGLVTTNIGPDDDQAGRIALQPDGKIVAAGRKGIFFYPDDQRNGDIALTRYNPDGSLDATFGNGGIVITDIVTGLADDASSLIIQPDGKIIVAGGTEGGNSGSTDFLVIRYNPNGALDTTFGTGGITETDLNNQSEDFAAGAALQPDGKIILVGGATPCCTYQTAFALTRYTSNGLLDPTFGTLGKVVFGSGELSSVVLQTGGKIIALGDSGTTFSLSRLTPNGSLDMSFGYGGTVRASFGSDHVQSESLVLQPDGNLVAGGFSERPYYQNSDFALARYLLKHGGTVSDFNGDGQSDPAVFQSDGTWQRLNTANNSVVSRQWGLSTDKIVPGDYDGDRLTDLAVFRPSEGNWYILNSSNGAAVLQNWGTSGDRPVPGDYDGDGRTDVAVFRPSEGNWYIRNSSNGAVRVQGWGAATDKLVPGDYDGDGKTDLAVWRPAEGNWYIINSGTSAVTLRNWGASDDQPVAGDYDGDGKTDLAVYRPSEGNWYILQSRSNYVTVKSWGASDDRPVPGDYDGDGKTDIAVFRPTENTWYIIRSWTGTAMSCFLGSGGDMPVEWAYVSQ